MKKAGNKNLKSYTVVDFYDDLWYSTYVWSQYSKFVFFKKKAALYISAWENLSVTELWKQPKMLNNQVINFFFFFASNILWQLYITKTYN